jgi:hypothetical protein
MLFLPEQLKLFGFQVDNGSGASKNRDVAGICSFIPSDADGKTMQLN